MNNQDDNHDGDQGVTGDARLWEGRQLGRGQEQQLWKVFILMLSFDDDDDDDGGDGGDDDDDDYRGGDNYDNYRGWW